MIRAEEPPPQGQREVTERKSYTTEFGTQVSVRAQHSSHTARGVAIIEGVSYPHDTSKESQLRTVQKRPEILTTVHVGEEQPKATYNSIG